MNHDIDETLSLYALGALDAEDARTVENLVARNPHYRQQLATYLAVADQLAEPGKPPAHDAPPALKDRLDEAIDALEQPARDPRTARLRDASRQRRTWRTFSMPRLVVPALAATTIFLAGFAASQSFTIDTLEDQQAALIAAGQSGGSDSMIETATVAEFETSGDLAGMQGEVAVKSGQALLVLESLPDPPEGMEWRVYAVHDGDRMDSMAGIDHGEDEMLMPLGEADYSDVVGFKIFLQEVGDTSDPDPGEAQAIGMFPHV